MPEPAQRCLACSREFNARWTSCPFCNFPVARARPKKPGAERWTKIARALLAEHTFFYGRHLETIGAESWMHVSESVPTRKDAEALIAKQNGYGRATVLEVTAVVDRPFPMDDHFGPSARWAELETGKLALACPSFEWPRTMDSRERGLGIRALAISRDEAAIAELARKCTVRAYVLRSWGSYDTDTGNPY